MGNEQARQTILSKLTEKLNGASENDQQKRRQSVEKRLTQPPQHLRPHIADLKEEERFERFKQQLKAQGTQILVAERVGQITKLIGIYLKKHNLGGLLQAGENEFIQQLDWHQLPDFRMKIKQGAASGDEYSAISQAVAGAAETGTLFLASGVANPTTLNFLPELHIILIDRQMIFGSYEEAWEQLFQSKGIQAKSNQVMPRCVNWISGPSRTADIEQTLVRGAHGPIDLLVVIYGSED